jgi:hypothetical protein
VLKSPNFAFQLFHPAREQHIHAAILGARLIKADLARAVLAVPLGHCSVGFGFLQIGKSWLSLNRIVFIVKSSVGVRYLLVALL